jgi:hypothetical protein
MVKKTKKESAVLIANKRYGTFAKDKILSSKG